MKVFCCKLQWDDSDSGKWSAKAKLKSENDENVRNETCGMQQQRQQELQHQEQRHQEQRQQHLVGCASTPADNFDFQSAQIGNGKANFHLVAAASRSSAQH